MSKVRVYELAKEYGIKGPVLAKMLKELGFEKVKSHMAVLDDATELHARAVMEAYMAGDSVSEIARARGVSGVSASRWAPAAWTSRRSAR